MRTRSLILLVLLVPLTGCVVTYGGFPNATLESLPKDHEPKPLYYHVEPIITLVNADIIEKKKASSRLVAGIVMAVLPSWYAMHPQIDPVGQPGYHEVARTLRASGMFAEMVETASSPNTGVFCDVSFEVRERSGWVGTFAGAHYGAFMLSGGLLAPFLIANVLPYYAGEGGTTVVYTLYRDGQLTQTYRYPITKKGAGWIVLLPFAWLNFFTNDLKDAVHGATLQFLIDAQRDGNL